MDALIENDTRDTHFQLSSKASKALLEYIYPDVLLFPTAERNLLVGGPAEQKHVWQLTMDGILQYCRKVGLYGKPTNIKGRTEDMWFGNCPALGPQDSTELEVPLANFFNTELESIQTTCDTMEPMYVRPLLVSTNPDQPTLQGNGTANRRLHL